MSQEYYRYPQPSSPIQAGSPHSSSSSPCKDVYPAGPERSHPSSRALDQFYTDEDIARQFLTVVRDRIDITRYRWIEPSAGCGAFYRLLPPGSLGYDLQPKFPGIMTGDFFKISLPSDRPVSFIGNPPFGRRSSLAIEFLNHAAMCASYICMILPPTFRKASVVNKLHRSFHCIHDEDVPANAFIFNGKPHHVPAVFQIWERRATDRPPIPTPVTHPDFAFTDSKDADIAIRRIGANAGRLAENLRVSEQSHYFIQYKAEHTDYILRTVRFSEMAARYASFATGPRSLSKPELILAYDAAVQAERVDLKARAPQ